MPAKIILWTPEEDAKLADLRARKVPWLSIPNQMPGRTIQACQQRLLYIKAKAEGKKKGSGGAKKAARKKKAKAAGIERREKLARKALAYAMAKAEMMAAKERAAQESLRSAPSPRRVSTHILLVDAELRERIAVQGPNGIFGDPKPGRSALDERNARNAGASA